MVTQPEEALRLGLPRGISAWKSSPWGWQGAGGRRGHFRAGFPEPEEDLGVEGGAEGPFWPPVGWTGPFFLGIKTLFLLLNTLLGSSLFTKQSVSSESRLVL